MLSIDSSIPYFIQMLIAQCIPHVLWFLSSPTQPPFFLIYKEPFNLDLYYFAIEKAMVIGANFKFLKPSQLYSSNMVLKWKNEICSKFRYANYSMNDFNKQQNTNCSKLEFFLSPFRTRKCINLVFERILFLL